MSFICERYLGNFTNIDLSPYWNLINYIAKRRNDIQEARGVRNRKISNASNFQVHRWGVGGEWAVALSLDLGFKEIWTVEYSGKGREYDFIINGKKAEVKHNAMTGGSFYVSPDWNRRHKEAEIFISTQDAGNYKPPHFVTVGGWLWREQFNAIWKWKQLKTRVMAVEQSELNPMEDFLEESKKRYGESKYWVEPRKRRSHVDRNA